MEMTMPERGVLVSIEGQKRSVELAYAEFGDWVCNMNLPAILASIKSLPRLLRIEAAAKAVIEDGSKPLTHLWPALVAALAEEGKR